MRILYRYKKMLYHIVSWLIISQYIDISWQHYIVHTCTWNTVSLTTYMYMEHSTPHYIHVHGTQYPLLQHTSTPHYIHVHGTQYPSLHTCTCRWNTVSLTTTYMYMYTEHSIPYYIVHTCTWNTVSLTTYMYM